MHPSALVVLVVAIDAVAGQLVIHQPAAHVADMGRDPIDYAANGGLPDSSAAFRFDMPKDALVGPEDRHVVHSQPTDVRRSTRPSVWTRAAALIEWLSASAHGIVRGALTLAACLSVVACGVIPALFLPPETGVRLSESRESTIAVMLA